MLAVGRLERRAAYRQAIHHAHSISRCCCRSCRCLDAAARFFLPLCTSTITYVLFEGEGGPCAIIDSVLDYDPKAGRTTTASADRVIEFVRTHGLQVQCLLETHAHADHLSAAPYLWKHLGGTIAIGAAIRTVQGVFGKVFNLEPEFCLDGSQCGHLFQPDEVFHVGKLRMKALHVPGHTPADMAYMLEDESGIAQFAFVGDTLFMPDVGSARCDFPSGDARTLYASARKLLALPPATRLFMCHDYPPEGRSPLGDHGRSAARKKHSPTMASTRPASSRCARSATPRSPCRC
jgi:glyoxylase-like metal-dependent hydrolase (beta-lactamase superfamily II)